MIDYDLFEKSYWQGQSLQNQFYTKILVRQLDV